MKTYTLALIGLLAALGTADAQNPAGRNHSKAHTDQFLKQCLDATDNRPFCNCALQAFKQQVPAGETRLQSHEQHEQPVLAADQEHLDALAPAIQRCEEKHPKRPNQAK